jgi:hypothetical protein
MHVFSMSVVFGLQLTATANQSYCLFGHAQLQRGLWIGDVELKHDLLATAGHHERAESRKGQQEQPTQSRLGSNSSSNSSSQGGAILAYRCSKQL